MGKHDRYSSFLYGKPCKIDNWKNEKDMYYSDGSKRVFIMVYLLASSGSDKNDNFLPLLNVLYRMIFVLEFPRFLTGKNQSLRYNINSIALRSGNIFSVFIALLSLAQSMPFICCLFE
jgi:hypothetical protein